MMTNNQTCDKFKLKKLFDTCKLEGKWKKIDDSIPRHYVALEDGASINLCLVQVNFTESFIFKKNSHVTIKDSLAEFQEEDILR